MKCPYCGGEIGLEEKYCSWCGRPNEQAVLHRQNMERFQAAWRDTEKAVEKQTKHYVRLLPRLIVILVLLLVIGASAVIGSQAWEFNDAVKRRAAEHNASAVCAVLDGYLQQRDYKSFASYAEYHNLTFYGGPFADYSNIRACASDYASFLLQLEEFFLRRESSAWQKEEASGEVRFLSSSIARFYDTLGYLSRRDLTDRDELCIQDMHRTVDGMCCVFLGLDETALQEFLNMTENRQAAFLEEVLLGA